MKTFVNNTTIRRGSDSVSKSALEQSEPLKKPNYYNKGIYWLVITLIALSSALYHQTASADKQYLYEYISLNDAHLPLGFMFFSHNTLGEDGKVYGSLSDIQGTTIAAVYENGAVTTIPGLVAANPILGEKVFTPDYITRNGLLGGSLFYFDPINFNIISESAVFKKGKLAQLPGFGVCGLTDSGTALVSEGRLKYSIVKKGITTPVVFGSIDPLFLLRTAGRCGVDINNQETIAGTASFPDPVSGGQPVRGFVLTKGVNQNSIVLDPKDDDNTSVAIDINNQGNVFGISILSPGRPGLPFGPQSVGLWQNKGGKWTFKTYFTQNTANFPTLSNGMVANDKNEMVIFNVSSPAAEKGKSYLITEPGERIDLREITQNIPIGQDLCSIDHFNDRGDITGSSCGGDQFLLKRIINEDVR
jgi:hypothetical protein